MERDDHLTSINTFDEENYSAVYRQTLECITIHAFLLFISSLPVAPTFHPL